MCNKTSDNLNLYKNILTPNKIPYIIEIGVFSMWKWDKLLKRIYSLSKDFRFEELSKVLESYGYQINAPKGVSSHYISMSQLKKFM